MLQKAVKDATVTTLLAILILGPMVAFILDGYEVEIAPSRMGLLGLIIFFLSAFYSLLSNSKALKQYLHKIFPVTKSVEVKERKKNPLWNFMGIAILWFVLPLLISKYWLTVAILALIYILLGLGLNVVVGLAGLLNLGFVAFYAIGAYAYTIGAQYFGLGFWSALPFGALLAGLFGAVLAFPVLRMHGDYLAIVTLGFGEIVRLILNNWSNVTGGPNGMSAPSPTFFGLEFSRASNQGGVPFHTFFHLPYDIHQRYLFIYFILFFMVLLISHFVIRLQRMPLGRAWEALREDEIACRSLGINHVSTKLSAFSIGAVIGGIGGVFFAAFEGFVNPTSFTFTESALILSIVVLGGMGSVKGVIIAAIVLTLLPEGLREFADYRMLLFGSIMVIMMIWRPQGLIRGSRQWIPKPSVVDHGE